MKPVQWLLVGGPAHGQLMRLGSGRFVLCDGTTYESVTYAFRGEIYRVGCPVSEPLRPGVVERLIEQVRPETLAEAFA